ncbi:MAG TPA: hypothetical protein VNO70_20800, partial [Blastocatellia bacterium]|nr:hypothetical protein [Blastocatellia bacterium]
MVKRALLCLGILGAMAVGGWAMNAAPTNFAGTWELDKAKSENLPRGIQNVESLTWVVSQDDKQLTIDPKVVGGQAQGMAQQKIVYNLDGSDTTADVAMGQLSGKATRKAKWMDGGKILELHQVINADFQGNPVTITTMEHWELS